MNRFPLRRHRQLSSNPSILPISVGVVVVEALDVLETKSLKMTDMTLIGTVLLALGGLIASLPLWQEFLLSAPGQLHDPGVAIWFALGFSWFTAFPLIALGAIIVFWGFLVGRKT